MYLYRFYIAWTKERFKKIVKKKRIGQKTQELSVSWSSYNTFKKNTQKDDFSRYGWATSNFHKVKQIVLVFAYKNQYFFVYCKAINHVVRKNVAFSFFLFTLSDFLLQIASKIDRNQAFNKNHSYKKLAPIIHGEWDDFTSDVRRPLIIMAKELMTQQVFFDLEITASKGYNFWRIPFQKLN